MKKIYDIKCGNCGKVNQLLNNYAYYFRIYQKVEPKAILSCECGTPIKMGEIGKKRI